MRYAIGAMFGFFCGLTMFALAQPVTTPSQTAIVCAFNASTPTGPATGNYILAQCDAFGRLRTAAGGWP